MSQAGFSLKKGRKQKPNVSRIALNDIEPQEDAEPVVKSAQFVDEVTPADEPCIIIPPSRTVEAKEPKSLEEELKSLPPPPDENDFEELSVESFGNALLRGIEKRYMGKEPDMLLNTAPLPKPRSQYAGVGAKGKKDGPLIQPEKKRKTE